MKSDSVWIEPKLYNHGQKNFLCEEKYRSKWSKWISYTSEETEFYESEINFKIRLSETILSNE